MLDNLNPYQLVLLTLTLCWLIPITSIWIRFDTLPHARHMLVAILLWPGVLMDEYLRAYGGGQGMVFLAGLFQFTPVLVSTLLFLSIHRLIVEKPIQNETLYYLPAVLMVLGQVPFLLQHADTKYALLMTPPVGALSQNWLFYAPYLFSGFVILVLAIRAVEALHYYHASLSEQVVDINLYRFNVASGGFIGLVAVAFCVIILSTLATFDLLAPPIWQNLINLFEAAMLLFLIIVLLEKRRYAPNPLAPDALENAGYNEEYLRLVLQNTETALIRYKAYKRIGLRLRQLADAAKVEPAVLAYATHKMLNRNFRAFIYHYRLEYAKKVLMRTDAKVSVVARRLGFNSDKQLSDVFIKYIQSLGKPKPAAEEKEQTT